MMLSIAQVKNNWSMCKMPSLRQIERSFSLPDNVCEYSCPVEPVSYRETDMHQKADTTDSKIGPNQSKKLIRSKKTTKINHPDNIEQDTKLNELKIEVLPKITDEQIVDKTKRKKEKEEKKKKWRNIDPADMGFNLTLFPRQPNPSVNEDEVHAILEQIDHDCIEMEEKISAFKHVEKYEGNRISDKYLRLDRHRKIRKAHKQVKDKYCRNVRNNDGRQKLYVHHRVMKVARLAEKREYLHHPSPKNNYAWIKSPSKIAGIRRSAPTQNLNHALWHNNVPTDIPTDLVSLLITLQHRDLTPEDYDTLLQLDDSVPVNTISVHKLQSFKTDVVDERCAGDICSVCLDPYLLGQSRKFLPCDHCFHVTCIDMWLQNSSMNCPLDGLPVGD